MALIDLSVVLSGSSSLGAQPCELLALTLDGSSSFSAQYGKALATNLGGSSSFAAHARVKYAGRTTLGGSSSFAAHAGVKRAFRATFDGSSGLIAAPTSNHGLQAPIRYQSAPRVVNVSKLVLDQVDLFRTDGKTRAQGVTVGDLSLELFFNGSQIEWPLVSGSTVQDIQVTAGQIYWTEFLEGFYTIRFFPNVVGSWRVLLTYPAYDQAVSLSYDVALPAFVPVSSGIRTSFIKR